MGSNNSKATTLVSESSFELSVIANTFLGRNDALVGW